MNEELQYYYTILDILERDLPYDSGMETEHIQTQSELIRNSINMRLIADPLAVLHEQYDMKLACCRLLMVSMEVLQVALKSDRPNYSAAARKRAMLMGMVKTLEDLYEFLRDFADRPVRDRTP